jgi:hypothetical protein
VLEKILTPPAFDLQLEPHDDGFFREETKPWSPEKRLGRVLEGVEISPPELVAALQKQLSQKTQTFNVLPALILTAPLLAKNAEARKLDYERNASLAKQFDPAKTKLGDREQGLGAKYGPPLTVVTNGGTNVYQFNLDVRLNVNAGHRFSGLSVVTESGKVTRIFSRDFYCATGPIQYINHDPSRPRYFCSVHRVFFDDPLSPHMSHGR